MDDAQTAQRTTGSTKLGTLVDPVRTAEPADRVVIDVEGIDFHYGPSKALHDVSLKIPERKVTAFIGPSGCG